MRISQDTRFPHPVLTGDTDDFLTGEFDVTIAGEETPGTGALVLRHTITLTQPAIRDLVVEGRASVGCFIACEDTIYNELRAMQWPEGQSEFPAGCLINRVTLRPFVWLNESLPGWDPGTIHPEFEPPVYLNRGDLLAIGPEHRISIGLAKFAPLDSIFQLDSSPDVPEGRVRVAFDADRITIVVAPATFNAIQLLRGQAQGRHILMAGVYMPAVMETLDALRKGGDEYDGFRWYQPFIAKCDAMGVYTTEDMPVLENAQILLRDPLNGLVRLASEGE